MANYCFLIRHILELLKNKDFKPGETSSFRKFFEFNYDQEIFNDIGNYGHVNEITSEKQRLRGFSSDTTELSTLPSECLERIFNNIDENGYSGLFSCLLVCRAWCRNVVPILWSRPFDRLSKNSRHKLIRTYITCLSNEEKSYLNSQFTKFGIKIPTTSYSLFNYPIYLKDLSYVELYQTVDSGIKHYRKSFIGKNTYKLTYLLTKSICRMILTKNIIESTLYLQSFKFDKHFIQTDIFPELGLFSKVYPGLSQITKFILNYNPKYKIKFFTNYFTLF